MKQSDFLVVVPAYNEEATIAEVVTRAQRYVDVCVVDDASRDATPQILRRLQGVHVIRHDRNTHIPTAIVDGMRYARENRYKYAITMDAGLSHNPDEIPLFMNDDDSDLLMGVRAQKTDTPFHRKALSLAGNFVYNVSLDFPRSLFKRRYYRDISSGFRRYSDRAMSVLLSKNLESKSFDFLVESTIYIYQSRLTISEVPISYSFSNSSLSPKVVGDCVTMCLKSIFGRIR